MELKKVNAIVLFAATLVVSSNLFAQSAVRGKDYTCNELRVLLQQEGELSMQGFFGATPLHQGKRACAFLQRPVRATWRTKDKFFCRVGYTCTQYEEDEDD